jgi:perosamine synthetase
LNLETAAPEPSHTHQVPFFRPAISEDDVQAVVNALRSGWLTRGPKCEEFERAFAATVGARYAVAVNSGTAALLTALTALGIGPGQVVVMPSLAFTATAQAVLVCGATPLFADCDRRTLCLDPDAARSALAAILRGRPGGRPLAGAIIPIHYGGALGDIAQYRAIAREFGLRLIHDGAHCLHTAYQASPGAPWTSIGAVDEPVCYSFYAAKCITTGEGGMVTTNDAALAARMRRVSFHGITPPRECGRTGMNWDYDIGEKGYKANLSDVLAALGTSQLARAAELNERRGAIATFYRDSLRGRIAADVPEEQDGRRSSWHIFPLRLHLGRLSLSRDEILLRLRDIGVNCAVHWRPLHHFKYYRTLISSESALAGPLPVTDEIFPQLLSLPISPAFTDAEVERVVAALKTVLDHAHRPAAAKSQINQVSR